MQTKNGKAMDSFFDITINAEIHQPKYEQLKYAIKTRIVSLPEQVEYLPYENDLAGKLGVSRQTVSRAYAELRKDGIIETVKNRGSKIINRDFRRKPTVIAPQSQFAQPVQPSLPEQACGTIAAMFNSDREDSVRTAYLPWRVTDVLERNLVEKGGSVAVYNTRSSEWQDADKILESFRANKIRWAYVHASQRTMQLLPKLAEAGVRLAMQFDTLSAYGEMAGLFGPNVNLVQLNNPYALCRTVATEFADADGILYLTNNHDKKKWSDERKLALKQYTETKGIEFHEVVENIPNPLEQGDNFHYSKWHKAGFDGVCRQIDFVRQCKRPLCIGNNDRTAVGVVDGLVENGLRVPQDVRVIGYDNLSELRSYNLSTFDFNPEAIGQAILGLYERHLNDPEHEPYSSRAVTVYPKFIRRMTT